MANRKKAFEKAYKAKDDEYYTMFDDIASEVQLYKEQLKGKRIICPCDWDESYNEEVVYCDEAIIPGAEIFDKGGSVKCLDLAKTAIKIEKDLSLVKCNFVKFLVSHAVAYGVKSISVSGYNPKTGEGVRFEDVDYSKYDVVITNPPFSRFRDLITTLFKSQKQFLVIGPTTALTYKDVFAHIMANEMWLGYHHHLTGLVKPDGTVLRKGDALPRGCGWYTNLDVAYRHEEMILTEHYNPIRNPAYCNFKGIDVPSSNRIPCDYDGLMGVPVTFLEKYNPDQFEILGSSRTLADPIPADVPARIRGGLAFYVKSDGVYRCLFTRIVIRNKEPYHDDEH